MTLRESRLRRTPCGSWKTLGRSVQRRPIQAFIRGAKRGPTILVIGGFHGDEPKSVFVARRLIDELTLHPQKADQVRWIVVPALNPDGYERRRRQNARGVDLNRNFPTKNWASVARRGRMYGGPKPGSEPETTIAINLVKQLRPACIITIHSISQNRFCNNFDGPARSIARAMSNANGYPVSSTIGYPTPGSFGTWAGIERQIPTITLELPSRHSSSRCWRDNQIAILKAAVRVASALHQ